MKIIPGSDSEMGEKLKYKVSRIPFDLWSAELETSDETGEIPQHSLIKLIKQVSYQWLAATWEQISPTLMSAEDETSCSQGWHPFRPV